MRRQTPYRLEVCRAECLAVVCSCPCLCSSNSFADIGVQRTVKVAGNVASSSSLFRAALRNNQIGHLYLFDVPENRRVQ